MQTPTTLGLILWLEGAMGVLSGGNVITCSLNQLGSGNDASHVPSVGDWTKDYFAPRIEAREKNLRRSLPKWKALNDA